MFSRTGDSAVSLIYGRFSFGQFLLIISYVFLESSLLGSIGNLGQIQDLLARKEADWNPHIGEETYPDMIQKGWSATTRETRRAWKEIRQYMIQQNLLDSTIPPSALREMLGQLLFQIERISAQGFNAVQYRRATLAMSWVPLSERSILALICISVSVTTTPGGSVSLQALLADPHQEITEELGRKLPKSPLFHKDVPRSEIQDAFKSLDELFRFQLLNGIDEQLDAGSRACDKTPPMTRLESWTYSRETREAGPSPRGPSSRPTPAAGAVLARESANDARRSQKRRKRTLSGKTEDVDQGPLLQIQYPKAK